MSQKEEKIKQREDKGRRGETNLELFVGKIDYNTQILQELGGAHHIVLANVTVHNRKGFEFFPRECGFSCLFDGLEER